MSHPIESSCANHPDRPAVEKCATCGKLVCDSCVIEFVAAEQVFCSASCHAAVPTEVLRARTDNAALETAGQTPIRNGWVLWVRSIGRIALYALPVAIVAAITMAAAFGTASSPDGEPSGLAAVGGLLALVLTFSFGMALVGVILTEGHTGLVREAPVAFAARRYLPWVATWVLMTAIVTVGYFLFIIPGIYLALRFFWADEYALIHRKGPIAALQASWELTRDRAAEVFGFQFILGLASYLILIPTMFLWVFVTMGLERLGLVGPTAPNVGIELFGMVFVALVCYGALHGPELVKFYGWRAAAANRAAGRASIAGSAPGAWVYVAAAAVGGLLIVGILGAIAIPNFLHAVDRGKGKRTLNDSRAIAVAIETYAIDHQRYPQAETLVELDLLLVPDYISFLPPADGWSNPFAVVSTAESYEIRSAGKDGIFETGPPRGPTVSFDADIVLNSGEFVQWPDHADFE